MPCSVCCLAWFTYKQCSAVFRLVSKSSPSVCCRDSWLKHAMLDVPVSPNKAISWGNKICNIVKNLGCFRLAIGI